MAKKRNLSESAKAGLSNYNDEAKNLFSDSNKKETDEPIVKKDPAPIEIEKEAAPVVKEKVVPIEKASVKREVGRPSGEKTRHVSITIPERLWPEIEKAALLLCKGNTSKYFTKLVEKDIEEKGAHYNEIYKHMEMIGQ